MNNTKLAEHPIVKQYIELNFFLIQLDGIDLNQVLKQLYNYLSCLTSPDSEQFLPQIQEQLQAPHSWLAKAALISQVPEQVDKTAKLLEQETSDQAIHLLLSDVKRRIDHFLQRSSSEALEQISQIYNGIHVLFNDKLPLNEVREEVSGFLTEKEFTFDASADKSFFEQLLIKAAASSLVNSLKQLTKWTKALPIQTEIFLKKFSTALENTNTSSNELLDEKLELQFYANQFYATQLMEQVKSALTATRNQLSEKIMTRLSQKISTLSLARIIQQFTVLEKQLLAQTKSSNNNINTQEKKIASLDSEPESKSKTKTKTKSNPNSDPEPKQDTKIQQEIAQQQARKKEQLQQAKQQENLRRAEAETKRLESHIEQAEQTVKTTQQLIQKIQAILTCAELMQSCFHRADSSNIKTQLKQNLTIQQADLQNSLANMDQTVHWTNLGLPPEQITSIQELQKSARYEVSNCLTTVEQLIEQLIITNNNINQSPPAWLLANNKLLLSATPEALKQYSAWLKLIENISNKILQAILIMHFAQAQQKFSQAILNNINSWSSRQVDRQIIENTFSYLTIKLSPKTLAKIIAKPTATNSMAQKQNSNNTSITNHKNKLNTYRESLIYCFVEDCAFWLIGIYEKIAGWFKR